MRLCICGKSIPRRKTKGGQEKQYCSDKCRQKAYRERNKSRFIVEKAIRKTYPVSKSLVLSQLENKTLQALNDSLSSSNNLLQAELTLYERLLSDKRQELDHVRALLEEKDAEIARLSVLLESQSKKRKH